MSKSLFSCALIMSLLTPAAFADVTIVKRSTQPGVDDSILVAGYDQKIDQLDQMSDQISSKIFSRKSGVQTEEGPSRDGMTIALVKIKGR